MCDTHFYALSNEDGIQLPDINDFPLPDLPPWEKMDAIDYAVLCRHQVNKLTIIENETLRITVYRQLLSGLTAMQKSLTAPLSSRHLTQLRSSPPQNNSPVLLAIDSQTLLEYCTELTQLLLHGLLSAQTKETLEGLLFDLIYLQADELQNHYAG
ncbi:hypothetical protein ACGVWS_06895 [Enterobacteriaceae bacterium LUAb1]